MWLSVLITLPKVVRVVSSLFNPALARLVACVDGWHTTDFTFSYMNLRDFRCYLLCCMMVLRTRLSHMYLAALLSMFMHLCCLLIACNGSARQVTSPSD